MTIEDFKEFCSAKNFPMPYADFDPLDPDPTVKFKKVIVRKDSKYIKTAMNYSFEDAAKEYGEGFYEMRYFVPTGPKIVFEVSQEMADNLDYGKNSGTDNTSKQTNTDPIVSLLMQQNQMLQTQVQQTQAQFNATILKVLDSGSKTTPIQELLAMHAQGLNSGTQTSKQFIETLQEQTDFYKNRCDELTETIEDLREQIHELELANAGGVTEQENNWLDKLLPLVQNFMSGQAKELPGMKIQDQLKLVLNNAYEKKVEISQTGKAVSILLNQDKMLLGLFNQFSASDIVNYLVTQFNINDPAFKSFIGKVVSYLKGATT